MTEARDGMGKKTKHWLASTTSAVGNSMEKAHLQEYLHYLSDTKRLIWINFLSGVSRGVGIAVGFAVLGGLLLVILRPLAMKNLPVIGDWIAEIVRIVEMHK